MGHKRCVAETRRAERKEKEERGKRTREDLGEEMTEKQRRAMERAGETGSWLSVAPSAVNGTELSEVEFRDALALRYGSTPENLPAKCDGCGEVMSISHALCCKKGGLVHMRHNEVRDELGFLAECALSPSNVRDEPLINISHCEHRGEGKVLHENRGDLMIRGLWERGLESIVDVQVTNLESPSYRNRKPDKVIEGLEKRKKEKYEQDCLDIRRSFTPFITSVDGLHGRLATGVLKQLAKLLAKKWRKPYSSVCGYVRARLRIALVRATNRCIRGSRVPARLMSSPRQQWDDGMGLALFY